MANKITTAGKFIPLLDEVYRTVSLTAKLDGPEELVLSALLSAAVVRTRLVALTMPVVTDWP